MPEENNEILKHNHGEKHMKASFVTCHINPKKPLTTKINKHTPFDFSFFSHCSFDATKNSLGCYEGKNSLNRLYRDLREHVMKIINHEQKEFYH